MDVLLRHDATGHYYNGGREWVTLIKDARNFSEVDIALDVVAAESLDGMSLIVREADHQQEYILSNDERGRRPLPILCSENHAAKT